MQLLGLRTVIYPANDLDAARAWWTGFLGIDPYFVEPFYVGFQVAGYELGLLPDANVEEGAQVYWGVDDVQAAVDEALTAGASPHTEPSDVGGGIMTALVTNPDGGIVGFIFNPNVTG
jgi:catechol 2,3-dioxygenase-like lactoylglutathione lyase family enzyme